jgi:chromosome segregation ATPase
MNRAELEAEIERIERAIKNKEIEVGYLTVELNDLEMERRELREELEKLED